MIRFIKGQEEILIANSVAYIRDMKKSLHNTNGGTASSEGPTKMQYCPYHKSWNHSKEECNKLKELKYKSKTNKIRSYEQSKQTWDLM